MLSGCSTTQSVKPVVIEEGSLKDRIVREQVSVPAELTGPCFIEKRAVNTYGEAVDVALEALDALTDCGTRMEAIRGLNEPR